MKSKNLLPYELGITEEEITPMVGVVTFGEFLLAIGLKERIDKIFPKPKSGRGFDAWEYVFPLVLMIASGGRHLEDIRKIREDKGLRKLLSLKRVPTSDAIGDWLRRQGLKGDELLKRINKEILRLAMERDGIKGYTLDIDSLMVESEKEEARKTYKGNIGFMPLVGHTNYGYVIYYEFRQGNEKPNAKSLEFYRKCKEVLPCDKKIEKFRADSASYEKDLIEALDKEGVKFAIGAKQNVAVKGEIRSIRKEEWKDYEVYCLGEKFHIMNNSDTAFRLIVKRRKSTQMPLFEEDESETERDFIIATNKEEEMEEVISFYNERGEASENRIKELKIDFAAESMPCSQFEANAVYFGLQVLTYNLYKMFLNMALPRNFLKRRALTVRYLIFNNAGKIVQSGRRLYLKVKASIIELFEDIRRRIAQMQYG